MMARSFLWERGRAARALGHGRAAGVIRDRLTPAGECLAGWMRCLCRQLGWSGSVRGPSPAGGTPRQDTTRPGC
jgi:hypothetical protein